MKFKKIVASICAAAMAICTMAFAPLSASADAVSYVNIAKAKLNLHGFTDEAELGGSDENNYAKIDQALYLGVSPAGIPTAPDPDLCYFKMSCGDPESIMVAFMAAHYNITLLEAIQMLQGMINDIDSIFEMLEEMNPNLTISITYEVTSATLIPADSNNAAGYPTTLSGIKGSKTLTFSVSEFIDIITSMQDDAMLAAAASDEPLTWKIDLAPALENIFSNASVAAAIAANTDPLLSGAQVIYLALQISSKVTDLTIEVIEEEKEEEEEEKEEEYKDIIYAIPQTAISDASTNDNARINGYLNINDALNAVKTRSNVKLNAAKTNGISKEILQAINKRSKAVTLNAAYSDLNVTITKDSITDPSKLKSLDFSKGKSPLTDKIKSKFPTAALVKGISFTKTGDFGGVGSVTLSYKMDKALINHTVIIYAVQGNKLVKIGESTVNANGYANVTISNYSDLIFVVR